MKLQILTALLASTLDAATVHVAQTGSIRDIQTAVDRASAGDTIVIHAGTYRETVKIGKGPLSIVAAPGASVLITGADVIPATEWTPMAGKPVWRHSPWIRRAPTHPNDEQHRLIGRSEQVAVDGKLLKQVLDIAQLTPGTFYADPVTDKGLYIRLPDDASPAAHRVETSVRPILMDIEGSHVTVRGLRFAFASNRAQQAALRIAGSDNLVEDCTVEWTNGSGADLAGERNTARRLISRFNGQIGMSGRGSDNLMEDCTLEGNNVKGFSKGWEAGGIKVVLSRRFHILRCRAMRNDGPGFWYDIDNRDGLVEQSYAAENAGAGIFIEISETATVRHNICVRNGLKDERGAWQHAGILLGEAMRCIVEENICLGNRIGIEVRQQRVRSLPADPSRDRAEEKLYYSDAHVFRRNIAAFNKEWQFAFAGDNAFFGAKNAPEHLELLDPSQRNWSSQSNLYYAGDKQGLILWGAKWLPKHEQFSDPAIFERQHHLEQRTVIADPQFVDWEAGNYCLKPGSPAENIARWACR